MKIKKFNQFINESSSGGEEAKLLLSGGTLTDPEWWLESFEELDSLEQIAEYLGCPVNMVWSIDADTWYDKIGGIDWPFEFMPLSSTNRKTIEGWTSTYWELGTIIVDGIRLPCLAEGQSFGSAGGWAYMVSYVDLQKIATGRSLKPDVSFLVDLGLLGHIDKEDAFED